jgi:HAMP domain-containing protein
MGILNISMKVIIFESTGMVRILPNSGSSAVAIIGKIDYLVAFRQGQAISNLMEIGAGISKMMTHKTFNIKRFTDAYSVDFFQASRKNQKIILLVYFEVDEGNLIQTATLAVTFPKITEFQPHANPVSGVQPPMFSANNGFDKMTFEFAPENISVSFGTKLDPVLVTQLVNQGKAIGRALDAMHTALAPIGLRLY